MKIFYNKNKIRKSYKKKMNNKKKLNIKIYR